MNNEYLELDPMDIFYVFNDTLLLTKNFSGFVYLLFFVAELGDVTYLQLTINNIGAAAIAN